MNKKLLWDAYWEGGLAQTEGLSIDINPYPKTDKRFSAWRAGYYGMPTPYSTLSIR